MGGVDGREVAGNGGLGAQELGPGQARALRGGVDVVLFEDSPRSGGSNAVTETDELAGDAAVAPCGVADSHLDDETTQLHRGAGPDGRPAGLGPVAGDSASVPTQQGLWRDEPASSLRSGQGRRDRTEQGPVLVGEGWSVVQAVQHCELVTQHDDLEVLRASERTVKRANDTSNRYRMRHIGPQDASASCLVSRHDRILGTHRPSRRVRRG